MTLNSPVAGRAGAVRIQRLSSVALVAAETHGQRFDRNGDMRRVRDDPPVTTTGLRLRNLYEAHVQGAQLQKSHTKALHMILQFPTDLVDGDAGEDMLHHARSFAASIFGDDAVFADRCDRDEKSRHVVDLFVAPKYEKITKRTSKTAVSTSKHLKVLAETRGKVPTLRGQGQALQDAWVDYLRNQMGLDAARGASKALPGDDWLSPEQLEVQRLREEGQKLIAAAKEEAARIKTEATPSKLHELEQENKTLLNQLEAFSAFRDMMRATLQEVLGAQYEQVRNLINNRWQRHPSNPESERVSRPSSGYSP